MSIKETVKALTALRGISGQEDAVREYLCKAVEGHCESMVTDNLGNLIVTKKGAKRPEKKLVLSAHMDEVGFVVTRIEDDGMLCFHNVGGIMSAVAGARPVLVGDAALPGVIGMKPIHLLEGDEKEKYTPIGDMRIDMGTTSKEETAKLVAPGDMITFVSDYRDMGGNCFCAKAIDDRAGCAMLLELILGELPYDCTFAFTTQEESGCVGARAAAFTVAADIAIAVEGTTASDLPDVKGSKRVCAIGGGPVISHMDRGTIYDYELYRRATKVAEANNISWQTKEGIYGGNESRSYQQTGAGSKVLAVSVPVRYIHSATSVACWDDIAEQQKLLLALIEELSR
ncbi:MAG: M42 family peptidase [Angelakisella sp.]